MYQVTWTDVGGMGHVVVCASAVTARMARDWVEQCLGEPATARDLLTGCDVGPAEAMRARRTTEG